MNHKAELLMPAGSLLKLKTAILYGADAVYAGIPDLSLRTQSSFTLDELAEGISFAHHRGKKVYLTLNLFSHNKDTLKLPQFIKTVKTIQPDGMIIADPGVFQFVKDQAPELELHISTQANVCSWLTVDFWKKQGASLVVMGREVSFNELKEIRQKCPDIKMEMFIHGALCMSYSGRCLLSNYMAERGSNQGNCAHSCRWDYKLYFRLKDQQRYELNLTEENRSLFEFLLEEEFRPGQLFPLEQDSRGAYILNSKDLCLLPRLPEILALGIDSLKVEGRNKSAYYTALVARTYRQAIDDWYRQPEEWNQQDYFQELNAIPNRGYTLGFHDGRLTNLAHNYYNTNSVANWEFAGYVRNWDQDSFIFELKNHLSAGELIQFLSPIRKEPIRVRLQQFIDADTGECSEKVSAGQAKAIRIPISIFQSLEPTEIQTILPVLTLARKEKLLSEAEKIRLLSDVESQRIEIEKLHIDALSKEQKLAENQDLQHWYKQKEVRQKNIRMGLRGCCKKGCNGCLLFWNQDKE